MKKKEEIIRESAELINNNNILLVKDKKRREEFTKVLVDNSYPPYNSHNDILSWEEIFFKIGELNADANYAIVLGEKNRLEEELRNIKADKEPA